MNSALIWKGKAQFFQSMLSNHHREINACENITKTFSWINCWNLKKTWQKLCKCKCVNHSVLSDSVSPWTVACQALPSMEFSRQEYWSGLPFPSPGHLPKPGIELVLLYCRQIVYCLSNQGSPTETILTLKLKELPIFQIILICSVYLHKTHVLVYPASREVTLLSLNVSP